MCVQGVSSWRFPARRRCRTRYCGRCIARRRHLFGPLLALTDGLLRDIARVFNTKGRAYIYISNGHGAWEAALTNVLSKGDKILVLESGRFAIGWGESARRMGVEVEILKGDMRRAVRPAEVEARLKADKGKTIKAILVAQIDTASGVVNDIAAIGQAVKAAGHDALLMVDAVASLAACRSTWTNGASTSPCRARRRA